MHIFKPRSQIKMQAAASATETETQNVVAKNFDFKGKQGYFTYNQEDWFGVFVQNNCSAVGVSDDDILNKAWSYLKKYFEWEDRN